LASAASVATPKEATAMSRDIKYIGMDLHQEALAIAVLNGGGKLVMETILEHGFGLASHRRFCDNNPRRKHFH
jgi:hypothetical protein